MVWLHVEYVHVCVKAYTLYSWGGGGGRIKGALDESLCGYGNLELLSTFVPSICMYIRVFSLEAGS